MTSAHFLWSARTTAHLWPVWRNWSPGKGRYLLPQARSRLDHRFRAFERSRSVSLVSTCGRLQSVRVEASLKLCWLARFNFGIRRRCTSWLGLPMSFSCGASSQILSPQLTFGRMAPLRVRIAICSWRSNWSVIGILKSTAILHCLRDHTGHCHYWHYLVHQIGCRPLS